MAEDFTLQILASENMQKLFDLSIRIDERVKIIQVRHEQIDKRIDDLLSHNNQVINRISLLEAKGDDTLDIEERVTNMEKVLIGLDKRVEIIEGKQEKNTDRWNQIAQFLIQLVWVILAAYLLTKMHLQAPAVP